MLGSDRFAQDVRDDEAQARAYGISGVPFFVVDGKYGISGAQPADLVLSGPAAGLGRALPADPGRQRWCARRGLRRRRLRGLSLVSTTADLRRQLRLLSLPAGAVALSLGGVVRRARGEDPDVVRRDLRARVGCPDPPDAGRAQGWRAEGRPAAVDRRRAAPR